MIIALHITVYILTLVFVWVSLRPQLREEKGRATVADILTNTPGFLYIPIINTMLLIIVGAAFLVWEVFGVGTLCKKLWDKVKDIEL